MSAVPELDERQTHWLATKFGDRSASVQAMVANAVCLGDWWVDDSAYSMIKLRRVIGEPQ